KRQLPGKIKRLASGSWIWWRPRTMLAAIPSESRVHRTHMPPCQSLWHGDNLPPYQRLAMKSFVDCGHDYHLFSYRKFDVPAGVRWRDANEVLPEERVFFYGPRA